MRGFVFVSLFFLCGCFKYVPLEGPTTAVERGTPLRTYFIGEQSVDLHDVTAHNITSMDVEFVRQEDSELVLSASTSNPPAGMQAILETVGRSGCQCRACLWWRSRNSTPGEPPV